MRFFSPKLCLKLIVAAFIIFVFTRTHHGSRRAVVPLEAKRKDIPFVLTVCRGSMKPRTDTLLSIDEMQRRQVEVLLKSAAALTFQRRIRFVLLCDSYSTFESITAALSLWPAEYRDRLKLEYRPLYVPPSAGMLDIYAKCSTERLFLPWALPELEAVIYLDTDMFFLRPPEDFADIFGNFSEKHLLGATSLEGFYLQPNIDFPYYGIHGFVGAPLLANLTRWRHLPWDWRSTVQAVAQDYQERLQTGDQDILNIIFSEYPEYIYNIGCEWQGSIAQCHVCQAVKIPGFSLVHGYRYRFFQNYKEAIPMKVMFGVWEDHRLGSSVVDLARRMIRIIKRLETEGQNSTRKSNGTSTTGSYFCPFEIEELFKGILPVGDNIY